MARRPPVTVEEALLTQWAALLDRLARFDDATDGGLTETMVVQLEDPRRPEEWGSGVMPIDTLPLFSTGGNCHRFAALLDFGAQSNLSNAPIVFDMHTCDPPLAIVAHGPDELLALLAECGHVEVLEAACSGEDDLECAKVDFLEPGATRTALKLRRAFDLPVVESVHDQVASAAERRSTTIVLEDDFGVGVLKTERSSADPVRRYEFGHPDARSLGRVGPFLSTASHDECLGFVRDAQCAWIWDPEYDGPALIPLVDALAVHGYGAEAGQVRRCIE